MPQIEAQHHHQTLWQRLVRFARLVQSLAAGRLILGLMLAAIAVNTWIFIEVAEEVVEGETQAFDELVLKALRDPQDLSAPAGPEFLAKVARDITALGSIAVLLIVTFTVVGYLLFARQWNWAGVVATASIGGMLLTWLLKDLFERARPDVVPHLDVVTSYSFPSGHSMISAVVYLTLGAMMARLARRRRIKLYCLAVALLLAFLVGLSRVYVGVHYPTDVVAGWSAGMTWAGICWLGATWLERRSRLRGGELAAEKRDA